MMESSFSVLLIILGLSAVALDNAFGAFWLLWYGVLYISTSSCSINMADRMLYFKKHETDKGDMLALCDEELLGKVHKDDSGTILDLVMYADFYKGELLEYDAAKQAVIESQLYTANIVGEDGVKLVIELGIADESA